jgi:transcriptional regulator with XRE-family HTH domain
MQNGALLAGVPTGIDRLVAADFTVGDLIRKVRKARKWNQAQLGQAATKYPLRGRATRINPNTVSNAERNPYNADFGTIWRLLAALGISLCDMERRVSSPFDGTERMEGEKPPAARPPQARRVR